MYLMEYSTICRRSFAEITEKKSRFLAQAIPVESEDAAREALEEIRKTYWDARHHVFAYRVGIQTVTERFSDDGEPARTAGLPILDVIKGANVQNTLIVVTRYFGGTLLGTGGLVRAYTHSAKAALEEAGIMKKATYVRYTLAMSYPLLGKIQYGLTEAGYEIEAIEYEDSVSMQVLVREPDTQHFQHLVSELSDGKIQPLESGRALAAKVESQWVFFPFQKD